jgi:hypothetical protein
MAEGARPPPTSVVSTLVPPMDIERILAELALNVGGELVADVSRATLERFAQWAQGGHLYRLLHELDTRFGDAPAFSSAGLAPLADDSKFIWLLANFRAYGELDAPALASVIAPHVGWTEELSNEELSFEIAKQIIRVLPRAEPDEREGIHLQIDQLSSVVATRFDRLEDAVVRIGERDPVAATAPARRIEQGVPQLARMKLDELASEDDRAATSIRAAIYGDGDPSSAIAMILSDPPGWLLELDQKPWITLAELAELHGARAAAQSLFESAAERPGSERVSCLARASIVAHQIKRKRQAERLLGKAKRLEPANPDVAFAELWLIEDEKEKLARLDELPKPASSRQRWLQHIARAQALITLGRFGEAYGALSAAEAARTGHPAVKTLRALIAIGEAGLKSEREERLDPAPLLAAAASLLGVREQFRELGRHEESGLQVAFAARAYVLAGEPTEARAVLDELLQGERSAVVEAGHSELAAAMSLIDPVAALDLLPEPTDRAASRLAWAQAIALARDEARVARAVKTLDRLLDEADGEIRAQAAFTRLALSLQGDAPWSEAALRVLVADDPAAAASIEAQRLQDAGDLEDAETRLLPHLEDAVARKAYVGLLWKQKRWVDVVAVLRPAVEARTANAMQRLMFADAATRADLRLEAKRVFEQVIDDTSTGETERDHAFHLLALLYEQVDDFAALERLTANWLEKDPENVEALWRRVLALHSLTRHTEAHSIVAGNHLEPNTEMEARLLAIVAERALSPQEAVLRLRELSDHFDRPETLEALLLITSLHWNEGKSEALAAELGARLDAFVERFPDSQAIRAISFDSEEGGVEALFKEITHGAAELQSLQDQVIDGTMVVAAYAAARGKSVTQTWWELQGTLPLAYPDQSVHDLERADASAAIGHGVAYDGSTIIVSRFLSEETRRTIRAAFPSPRIARAVLIDSDVAEDATRSLTRDHLVAGGDAETGDRWVVEVTGDAASARADEMRAIHATAQGLASPDPDLDPDRPTQFDQFIKGDSPRAFSTMAATLALAERTELAVFSDDRRLRLAARAANIPAFGTVALLDALVGRGLLSADERTLARRALRSRGGLGLSGDPSELSEEARENAWRLTASLAAALRDRTAWRSAPGEALRQWIPFLAAARDSPEKLPLWLGRVIDAGAMSLPADGTHSHLLRSLLLLSIVGEGVDELFGDLIVPARSLGRYFPLTEDPLIGAWQMLNEFLQAPQYQPFAAAMRARALRQLPLRDQLAVLFGLRYHERWH